MKNVPYHEAKMHGIASINTSERSQVELRISRGLRTGNLGSVQSRFGTTDLLSDRVLRHDVDYDLYHRILRIPFAQDLFQVSRRRIRKLLSFVKRQEKRGRKREREATTIKMLKNVDPGIIVRIYWRVCPEERRKRTLVVSFIKRTEKGSMVQQIHASVWGGYSFWEKNDDYVSVVEECSWCCCEVANRRPLGDSPSSSSVVFSLACRMLITT